MAGMPTTEDSPVIMTPSEICVVKRQRKLEELLEHGDPFTGRFIMDFRDIAYYTKKMLSGEKIRLHPATADGIHGSKRLATFTPFNADLSMPDILREKLRTHFEHWRINFSIWAETYSFENFAEMIKEILASFKEVMNRRISTADGYIAMIPEEPIAIAPETREK